MRTDISICTLLADPFITYPVELCALFQVSFTCIMAVRFNRPVLTILAACYGHGLSSLSPATTRAVNRNPNIHPRKKPPKNAIILPLIRYHLILSTIAPMNMMLATTIRNDIIFSVIRYHRLCLFVHIRYCYLLAIFPIYQSEHQSRPAIIYINFSVADITVVHHLSLSVYVSSSIEYRHGRSLMSLPHLSEYM